jgi:type IV pilus assembly protein PilZ
MSAASPIDPNTVPVARPTVLSLAIKEKAALYAAYMPFLKNGGMFVPTQKPYKLGDEIYLILALMDDPTSTRSPARWPGSRRRRAQQQGAGHRRAFPGRRKRPAGPPAHRRNPRRRTAVIARHPYFVTILC